MEGASHTKFKPGIFQFNITFVEGVGGQYIHGDKVIDDKLLFVILIRYMLQHDNLSTSYSKSWPNRQFIKKILEWYGLWYPYNNPSRGIVVPCIPRKKLER